MRTVSGTRTVMIVGARPRSGAAAALHAVRAGEAAAIFVLGLAPTRGQRRLTDEALALAAERRFELTAELIPKGSWLAERLRDGDRLAVFAGRRERRRLSLPPAGSGPSS